VCVAACCCWFTDSGMRAFTSNETCCAPKTGAFGEGCSNFSIPLPCWVVDSYYPNRSCRRSSDAAVCYRGEYSGWQGCCCCCIIQSSAVA
jgi:hypothetical protein